MVDFSLRAAALLFQYNGNYNSVATFGYFQALSAMASCSLSNFTDLDFVAEKLPLTLNTAFQASIDGKSETSALLECSSLRGDVLTVLDNMADWQRRTGWTGEIPRARINDIWNASRCIKLGSPPM